MLTVIICVILSILCAAYGASVASIKSGSNFYMIWYAAAAVFLLLAIGYKLSLWHRCSPILRRILLTLFLAALVVFVGVEGMIASQFFKTAESNLDYVIVLGAQVRTDGPSVVLLRRLERAESYLKENPNSLCIVTGGQGANEPTSEAQAMAEWLVKAGIEESRIIQENRAVNTIQNIRYSMAFIEDKEANVGILTNSFHVFRGVAIAKKQGLVNACGIPAKSYPFYLPNNMLREFFGVLKDFAMGNL